MAKYEFLNLVDLRSIIVSEAAAKQIDKIAFCDRVIFPKSRDILTMQAIATIEMRFNDEILYLEDNEPIPPANYIKLSGLGMTILEDKDLCDGKKIRVSGCGVLIIRNLLPDKEYGNLKVDGVGAIICDKSVAKSRLSFTESGIGLKTEYDIIEDIKTVAQSKLILSEYYLTTCKKNTILFVSKSKIIVEKNVTNEMLQNSKLKLICAKSKVYCGKQAKDYLYQNTMLAQSKIIVKNGK